MLYRAAALVVVSMAAYAQDVPPAIDQALRARVTEFFGYHVDGNFRKAYELVAEDTKDQYLGAQKIQFKSFKIDTVKYSDNFTKAEVQLSAERAWRMRAQFPETIVKIPVTSYWHFESGKWMYHEEPQRLLSPMGPSAITSSNAPAAPSDGQTKAPNVSPEAIQAAARNIFQQSSMDKSEVVFVTDQESSDKVVFHNGFQGPVKVLLDGMPKIAGLQAEVDKTNLNQGENAVLSVRYKPIGKIPDAPAVLRLIVEPFHQVFTITVRFAPPKEHADR